MPEGHLIHYYATIHRRGLLGLTGVSSPQGKFNGSSVLDGRVLERIEPYGKHLFYWWDSGVVHVHLGMQGLFLQHDGAVPEPRKQVRLRVCGPTLTVDLIAPIQCDLITAGQRDDLVAGLGPDPLREDCSAEVVWTALAGRRQSIGAALLDQALVAGIGNVIRAEALHEAGIHPRRAAHTLSRAEFDHLWAAVVSIMRAGAATGRIVTAKREDGGERKVYKQHLCGTCGREVEVFDLSGRTAYACPFDQPFADPE